VTQKSTFILKTCLIAALVLLAIGVGPAAAKGRTPCWKTLINDWYDGRIDGIYAIHCYRDALKHLPADVETYSSARDDIKQALQKRITQSYQQKHGGSGGGATTTPSSGGPAGGTNSGGGGTPSPGGTTGGGSQPGGGTGTHPAPSGPTGGGQKPSTHPATPTSSPDTSSGPVGTALKDIGPSKADAIPIPLIVLGAVALLLMAAGGAGFVARRMRVRRLQLASAATLPQRTSSGSGAGR
jgi:hypothetical protein